MVIMRHAPNELRTKGPKKYYHLGYTLAKLNRIDEAKKELEYAVNVERPFFKRPQARTLLESL